MDNKNYSTQLKTSLSSNLDKEECLLPLFRDNSQQTVEEWERIKKDLKLEWSNLLGHPSFTDYEKEEKVLEIFEQPDFHGTLFQQSTGPNTSQLVLLMQPKNCSLGLHPGAIVPFYHPDEMAGYNIAKGKLIKDRPNIQFGLHLVRQGYVVACSEAYPFNLVPEPKENVGFAWWQAAAEKLKKDHPQWTGMGKLIWDTKRAVDLLLDQKNIDKEHIVSIGHSLGGKISFCTAAFDERIKAAISSDFGIGWESSNWDDEWYYGQKINEDGFRLANHQLLAMIAPRPFLLIGGQYDGPASCQYIDEAKKVYTLYQKENSVAFQDHASGHYPPEYAIDSAYRWLAEQFGLIRKKWK